jgi:hypothetical protein
LHERSALTARHTALLEKAQELAARIHEIRAAFGNPFFDSHPEHADESAAHYTGPSSHEVGRSTVLALRDVGRELGKIKDQLLTLRISSD